MEDEQRKTLALPAIAVNRTYISRITNGNTRLSFGEVIEGEMFYRVAVMLPEADVIALRDLLNQLFPEPKDMN